MAAGAGADRRGARPAVAAGSDAAQGADDAARLPVRDVRVLFGLKRRHYEGFAQSQVAQAHEFFRPMEALTAEDGHEDPEMRALIVRASAAANFMRMP